MHTSYSLSFTGVIIFLCVNNRTEFIEIYFFGGGEVITPKTVKVTESERFFNQNIDSEGVLFTLYSLRLG